MPKKILVIDGHPDALTERYVHALTKAYYDGTRSRGHEVRSIIVSELEFPLLRTARIFDAAFLPRPSAEASPGTQTMSSFASPCGWARCRRYWRAFSSSCCGLALRSPPPPRGEVRRRSCWLASPRASSSRWECRRCSIAGTSAHIGRVHGRYRARQLARQNSAAWGKDRLAGIQAFVLARAAVAVPPRASGY